MFFFIGASHTFVPTAEVSDRMRFLRKEKSVEVYLDLQTEEEVSPGRLRNPKDCSVDRNPDGLTGRRECAGRPNVSELPTSYCNAIK